MIAAAVSFFFSEGIKCCMISLALATGITAIELPLGMVPYAQDAMLQSVTTHLSFHSLNFQENFLMCVKHRAICRTSAVAVLAGSCAACSPLTFRSTNDGKVCVTTAQSLGPQV